MPWHRMYVYYFEQVVRAYVIANGGPANWALLAGPPSPLKPGVPVPATVLTPPFETLRTWWNARSAM